MDQPLPPPRSNHPGDLMCVHEAVAERATASPERTAVRYADRSLTYGELDERAHGLARWLIDAGVGPDVVVAVCIRRSLDLPVVLLGILRAGGAYLPLDPTHPAPRTAFLLEDSGAPVVVTQADLADSVEGHGARLILLDDETTAPGDPVRGRATLADLAYVIYTSGSTGTPKGAMVEHRSLANVVESMRDLLAFGEDDVVLAVSTLSFDIACLDVFLPLSVGGQVVIITDEDAMFGARIAAALESSRATLLQGTPAMWRMLLAAGWMGTPGLRMISTGEALTPQLATTLLDLGASVWNAYSATEGGIYATVHRVEHGETCIPIGRPIPNVPVRLLDDEGRPVSQGTIGEIYIAGAGPGRGYLHRPPLTAERFVPDPFASEPGARMYRTGDRGRERPDGEFEYLGRSDHQVKVRGFRVELGEVEAALRAHPAVGLAVATVQDDEGQDGRLVAYVEPAPGERPDGRDLRRFLMDRIPLFMVPSAIVVLDALPMTPTRKIDRQALPRA